MCGSMNCAKCGTLKTILKNGSRCCMKCHLRRKRGYYLTSQRYRESVRRQYLRRRYGTTLEFLENLLAAQNETCAICEKHWTACVPAFKARIDETFLNHLCVDHDHRTHQVRGLLCNSCNTAIGLLEEDYGRFLNAIQTRRHTAAVPDFPQQTAPDFAPAST